MGLKDLGWHFDERHDFLWTQALGEIGILIPTRYLEH